MPRTKLSLDDDWCQKYNIWEGNLCVTKIPNS